MSEDEGDDTEELDELPGGGLSAPWEDGPSSPGGGRSSGSEEQTEPSIEPGGSDERSTGARGPGDRPTGAANDAAGAGTTADTGDAGDGPGTLEQLAFLVPRFLALVVFVGLPATIAFYAVVVYFQLQPFHQVIGLLGFALLVRWALRPHLETFFTHPADREA